MRTNDELRQLAQDVFDGKVFTTAHFRTKEDMKELAAEVFTPLLFMNSVQIDKLIEDMGDNFFFYEYYDKAGVNTVKGYPVFSTLNYLTRNEYPLFLGYHALLEKQKEMKNDKGT